MKILLALDGSPHSDAALDEIRQRPWPPASVVRILSVIEPFTPPVAELGLTPSWEEIDRSRATQAEVLTARAAASLQSTNVQVVTESTVRHAPCSVEVVRHRASAEPAQ